MIDSTDAVGVIVRGQNGAETRVRVAKTSIKHSEPGPLKAGDSVYKTVAKKRVEGVVEHRSGSMAWVRFGDTHAVGAVEALTRS
ncbi:hypothetical protein [Methylobacterium sp. R2-1]|uniref:hypothetical protein n=1 Tax=Methylobacterium sp. R2-1 TaxID=2587064 RepID=UPI0016120ED0|nr:hypothetical protein [Methylobacterium sp. R2-1]MBB2965011.1 hypothetical protein [Methylobacterium sp. R2-1]